MKKSVKIEYEEANLSIFVDNRILYMKILLEKLLEVISELNKFTRYKSMHRYQFMLCTV